MKLPEGTMRGLLAGSLFDDLAAEAASRHTISPNAVYVLLVIEELHYKGRLAPSVELVKLQMGLSLPVVCRAVGQLDQMGLVTKYGTGIHATVTSTEAGYLLLKHLSSACWSEALARLKGITVLRKDAKIIAHE